jgi:hypothetical protein
MSDLSVKVAAMRICPDCAEENINENLFCQHCGRCLLSPDPEKLQPLTAAQTEHFQTPEDISVYDASIAEKTRPLKLKRHEPELSVILGWLFILNLLIIILISGIVIK